MKPLKYQDFLIITAGFLIFAGLSLAGCNDPGGSQGNETLYEYSYRVVVPDGFQADVSWLYHKKPRGIPKSTGQIEQVEGVLETEHLLLANITMCCPLRWFGFATPEKLMC